VKRKREKREKREKERKRIKQTNKQIKTNKTKQNKQNKKLVNRPSLMELNVIEIVLSEMKQNQNDSIIQINCISICRLMITDSKK